MRRFGKNAGAVRIAALGWAAVFSVALLAVSSCVKTDSGHGGAKARRGGAGEYQTAGRKSGPDLRADAASAQWREAESCLPCHKAIYEEWKGSRHRMAGESLVDEDWRNIASLTPEKLTAVSPDRKYRSHVFEFDPEARKDCGTCHDALKEGGPAAPFQGVNCAVCHVRGGEIFGPREVKKGPKRHAVREAKIFLQAEFCAGCHQAKRRGGTPYLTTFQEWSDSSYARDGYPCQTCHMQNQTGLPTAGLEKKTYRAHVWPGGSSHEQLGYSATLELTAQPAEFEPGGPMRVEVKIKNDGAGHYLPTGDSLRLIQVAVAALAPDGKPLGFAEFPLGYGEARNGTPENSAAGRGLAGSRIKPDGDVTVRSRFQVPADYPHGEIRAQATLYYRPVPPEVARAAGAKGLNRSAMFAQKTLSVSRAR